MILIADCGSTKINWCLLKDDEKIAQIFTTGMNALLMTEDEMAQRIAELVAAGAKVVSPSRPNRVPGLRGYPHADARLREAVSALWGKGVRECAPGEILAQSGIVPDFSADAKNVSWIHRRDASADWYFVAQDNEVPSKFEASFRISGKTPELWNAETGDIRPAPVWREENGRTFVRLEFPPSGSTFVVFRAPSSGKPHPADVAVNVPPCTAVLPDGGVSTNAQKRTTLQPPPDYEWRDGELVAWRPLSAEVKLSNGDVRKISASPAKSFVVEGAWDVAFPKGWSAPEKTVFPALACWTQNDDPGIKYFSGTAAYTKRVRLPSRKPGTRIMLDLGTVMNFAEVKVNGVRFPVLWKPPFRLDVTDAVPAEELELEVKVTNLWPNRLIGDDTLYPADCEWTGMNRRGRMEYGLKEMGQGGQEIADRAPHVHHVEALVERRCAAAVRPDRPRPNLVRGKCALERIKPTNQQKEKSDHEQKKNSTLDGACRHRCGTRVHRLCGAQHHR